jgi:hypothetical protein
MKRLSHKALERASQGLMVAGLLCLLGLLLPRSMQPPQDPPPDTTTLLASPRDAGIYLLDIQQGANYLGTPLTPIPRERFVKYGERLERFDLRISRPGFADQTIELSNANQVRAFFSKPFWPHQGVLRLEPQSSWAQLEVWARERALPLGGLLLVAGLAALLSREKARAARRADFLEQCKASAGEDPYIGKTLKEFLLVELLGRGNFGMVYRAIPEEKAGDPDAAASAVAIKISTNLDPKAVQRFYQELDVARQAEHPNNIRIFDKGMTPDGSPFLVMELLSGRALTDVITESAEGDETPRYLSFPLQKVLEMLQPVAEGLQHAHDRGVVHRDLNPNNIMVLDGGGVKILDFGLSKILANKGLTMTQDGGAGTLSYVPLEQVLGFGKVDARADQFSLGVIAYHMLSGSHPFGDLPFEVLSKVSQRQPPRPLAELAPQLSPQTVAVLERMLSHDPEQRFATVREAMRELRQGI